MGRSGFDAIVLAGGTGSRLGGVDKAAVEVGGQPLVDRVLTACRAARQVVVVGPERPLPPGVLRTAEEPPGGGPVAGLAAGLAMVDASIVVVLACDLALLSADTVADLVEALVADATASAALALDETDRAQPLAAAYRTGPLRSAIAAAAGHGGVDGLPLHRVVSQLARVDVAVGPGQAWDCDTWPDVRRARTLVGDRSGEEP